MSSTETHNDATSLGHKVRDYYVVETHNWGSKAALALISGKIDALATKHKLGRVIHKVDGDFLAKSYRTYSSIDARGFSSAVEKYADEVIDITMLNCGNSHDTQVDFYYVSKDARKWQALDTEKYVLFNQSKANKLLRVLRAVKKHNA